MSYELAINGERHSLDMDGDIPLLWAIRDVVGLTGTKFGCGLGLCGACTVLMSGRPIRSCQLPTSAAVGKEITTIEHVGSFELGLRVQRAWRTLDVPQCGYCQSGQIVSAVGLLSETPHPTDEQIKSAMSGNICRCGTYSRIFFAIKLASKKTVTGET